MHQSFLWASSAMQALWIKHWFDICVWTLLLLNKKYRQKMRNCASAGLITSKGRDKFVSIYGCWNLCFYLTMFIELGWTQRTEGSVDMTHWFGLQGWKQTSPTEFSSDLFQSPSYTAGAAVSLQSRKQSHYSKAFFRPPGGKRKGSLWRKDCQVLNPCKEFQAILMSFLSMKFAKTS